MPSPSDSCSRSLAADTNPLNCYSEKAHTVAAAAGQMAANVTSVAGGMQQTTANLMNVSGHTEQMTTTIGEIASNSERARNITEDAARHAARINEQMNQLGQAA
jgi:methyl-accepting chemotaxis protein